MYIYAKYFFKNHAIIATTAITRLNILSLMVTVLVCIYMDNCNPGSGNNVRMYDCFLH